MKNLDFEAQEIVTFLANRLKTAKGISVREIQSMLKVSFEEANLLLAAVKELFFITEYFTEDNICKYTFIDNIKDAAILNIPEKYTGKITALTIQEARKHNLKAYERLKKDTDLKEMIIELLLDILCLCTLIGSGYLIIHFLPV